MRADLAIPVTLRALQRGIQHVVHERRLARTADAGDAGQRVQRNLDVDALQVVLGRAEQPDALRRALAARRRHRNAQLAAQVLRRQRSRFVDQALERARIHHAAAVLAGAEAHVDEVIRHRDHVGVVLDDDHGVALIAELPEDGDQPLVVARVQANRRLIEHVERADQRRAQRGGEVDALRFAARQRRRQPIERQVVEADVAQEAQAPLDLLQHLVGDRRFLLGELRVREELLRFANGARRRLVDGHAADVHVPRFAAQPRALAIRAGEVAAIAAQEHADVHLVFLALEPAEESAHALEVLTIAIHDEGDLFRRQVGPRHVEANALRLGGTLQLGQLRAVVRLGPRLDRALVDRLRLDRAPPAPDRAR